MAQMIKGNYNALMWLQDELQQSLASALNAMNSYIDEGQDKALSDCIGELYQVKGTLDMINMSGAVMLADEMQQTAVALRDDKLSDKEQAQDALLRSLLLLPNYLKLLNNDFQDHPLSLIDSFNQLRAARQAESLSEQDLFKPILTVPLPDSITPNPLRKLPPIAIEQHKLGHAFQIMLLNWLRQQDQDSLRKMRGVTHYQRLASQEEKTTLLWWAAEALLEALEHDGLNASAEIKHLLGKLVMPIKTQSEHSEAALLEILPTDLINKLLLLVARSQSHGPRVTLLKTTFNLHFFDHKQQIYGMSDNALGDANLALLEQLEDLKTGLDHYNPDQDLDAALIGDMIQQLQSMTDTLALLAEYEASNLLHHQVEKLQAIVEDKQQPDEITLTELADALLQVEKFLQSSTQADVNDKLRNSVITECLLEMANIKETLTLMSQAQRHPDELGETEEQLGLIAGSMDMLNYPQAATILRQTVSKVADQSQRHEAFSPAQLNHLADILACCDIFMEGIRQHGHAEYGFLNDAQDKLDHFEQADELAKTPLTDTSAQPVEESQDPALQELDSLLSDSHDTLLFDAEPDQPGVNQSEAATEAPRQAETPVPAMKTEPPATTATALPDSEQWRFAEDIDPEIAEVFIEEATEVLAELDTLMPQWLNNQNSDALKDIRRHFHTLKGSGRMAGASVIGELAWSVEQVLNHVLDGARPETEQVHQLTAESHQLIPALLARFTRADNTSTEQVDALHALKEACLSEQPPAELVSEDQAETDDVAAIPEHLETETDNAISESSDDLVLIEPDEDPSLVEFNPADYQATSPAEANQAVPGSESTFTIDTGVLTGVERYLRNKVNIETEPGSDKEPLDTASLTTVEQYIRHHADTTAMADDAVTASSTRPLTGVEAYLRQQTGVARYLRRQAQDTVAYSEAEASLPVSKPYQPLTSVDRYWIDLDKQQRPATGVERYLADHDDQIEDEIPSLVEFNPADYQASSPAQARQAIPDSDSTFAIDTGVLTGVEHYLRNKASIDSGSDANVEPVDTPSLTTVEQYIRRHTDTTAIPDDAVTASSTQPLTGVEAYLRQQTGVARYIRRQAQDTMASSEPEPTLPVGRPYQPLTSVDRYWLDLDKQQRALTGVERYLADHDAHTEADDIAAEEDDELLQIFASEAAQHIENLQQGLDDIAFSRQLNKLLLRAVHSLKGCANIAGVKPMGLVATELDAAMKQLHAQDIVLDNKQMNQLSFIVGGLDQVLQSILGRAPEPDIRQLSAAVSELTPAEAKPDAAPLIDPEFLVVFLEETDELLDAYTRQLSVWQQQPDNDDNRQALAKTLYDLEQAASQAQQQQIADVYAALSRLIEQRHPETPGLDSLLEQGYEQLNQHIENLLQNKPLAAEIDFAERVDNYLASQPDVSASPATAPDIDETEFQLPADIDPELLDAFTEEAAELLLSSGQSIKAWQSETDNQVEPLQLQRDLHTIKGGARLTGITPVADLTHQIETLVLAVCDHKQTADEDFFDLLQRCQDRLSEMQDQLANRQPIETALSLIEEITQRTQGEDPNIENRPLPEPEKVHPRSTTPLPLSRPEIKEPVADKPAPHVEQIRVRAELLDYLTNFAGEVSIARDRVTQQHTALRQQLREMEETVSRLHDQLRKLEIETETQILFRYEDERLKSDSDFDPLELDRFSMIQQLSRGLTESVIDLNDISHSMDTLVKETDAILLQQSRINTDLQEGLMATRLLPFNGIGPRLERIVRQTASELEKKAVLTIRGAELELDRTILDRLVAPLEHILRNAIAHGIETPGERLANGKDEQGHLDLQIHREGSEVVLMLSDDGQGIDVDKVKQKALSLNLISADNIPSEEELIQLILNSGFSTADNISQVAGRGVGMDVVSNEIRSLKGRLSIQSSRGQGTTFVMRLPLTLSVIQSLLVRVQDEQYAVPLGSINAGERISVRDIKLMLDTHNPQYEFNGEQFDFMPLATLLDKPLTLPANLKQQLPLLLFRSGDIRVALLVDNIISNREVVIKSVGSQLSTISAINGATILGDGRVVFILDIPALVESRHDSRIDTNDPTHLERELNQIKERPPTAMVVDDSITMRKASGNLLKRLGFDVMTARDGVDALSQLHEQKPDIILLDVEMPRMDGFEFASIVRNDSDFRYLPIIMITSRTGQKHRERAMEIGVNAYLGKPYQEEELLSEMQKLLPQGSFPGRAT